VSTVYLTGASGFIGKHLTKRLDNFTAIPHQKIQTIQIKEFDKFFFLSAYGNLIWQQDDNQILQANLLDLINVLNQIDFSKSFKSFVFLSTSSVKLRRQTMYSRAKKATEEVLLAYAEKYNAPICIIRPFSITGVGEQKEHLIPTLIRSCLEGEEMQFTPTPVHDFIDIDDVVEGIINLSDHSAKGIFELGLGEGTSNAEVLALVEKITGKKANITGMLPARDYDNQNWVSNNFRSRMYGWLPKKSLEDSIKEMVNAYSK